MGKMQQKKSHWHSRVQKGSAGLQRGGYARKKEADPERSASLYYYPYTRTLYPEPVFYAFAFGAGRVKLRETTKPAVRRPAAT